MQRWDYLYATLPQADPQETANNLAAAGADGWELVALVPGKTTPPNPVTLNDRGVLEAVPVRQAPVPCWFMVFKRPRQEAAVALPPGSDP